MKIKVKVKPGSSKQNIVKISDEVYEVNLKSRPEDGKANAELLKMLRKEFKKDIKILRGLTSKNKIIEVNKNE